MRGLDAAEEEVLAQLQLDLLARLAAHVAEGDDLVGVRVRVRFRVRVRLRVTAWVRLTVRVRFAVRVGVRVRVRVLVRVRVGEPARRPRR